MKSHCFPFRQVPHSTRLFLDYLDHTPSVQPFYPRSARFLEWARDESSKIRYPEARRDRVAEILERQNKSFGAAAQTLESIAEFRNGAAALVTGQQVGLFGGPVFSLYKALSAVKMANEARKLGLKCVPIFWLATEDHDLEEVNQARIMRADGELELLKWPGSARQDTPVANVYFGPEISEVTQRAEELLGSSETATFLAECYRPGESFGTAFAKFFTRLFGEFGVVVLDGSDPELDAITAPVYQQVISQARDLNRSLLERDQELQAAGYHQQVRITNTSTPLFMMRDGIRVPLHIGSGDEFLVGDSKMSKKELLDHAESSPASFSPNVLLRPVVQDYVLPTLAYIGGAAEVAYFSQVGVVYKSINGRVTPILPRFSATLIEAKPQALLERYKLGFADLFQGPEGLREQIGARLLDSNLQNAFEQARLTVERSMGEVREAIGRLDKTLVESSTNAESKMLHQLSSLQARAARAELRQSEVANRHATLLSNSLYPDKQLQEREYTGISFLARYGKPLLNELLEVIHPDCVDHQLVSL